MNVPQPILVSDLFPETLYSLIDVLSQLSDEEWNRPTVCSKWSVKDIAAHLLGGKLGVLSRKRDAYTSGQVITGWTELVRFINDLNAAWVRAAARLSPRVLCELLKSSGEQVCDYFKSLDPYAIGDPVDWAGPKPAPVWLDVAREYTEWWHHQQQIRDAVGKPGLKEPRFFAPVIDTFVRALPYTYRDVESEEDTKVGITVTGDSGDRWILKREKHKWQLFAHATETANAETALDQETAWRLFTRGISKEEAISKATLTGERDLALKTLEMISVIA
jgi:uncharacterized protein (TIGR03083 family)